MLFTGIDLTEIERIKKSCQNPRFIARVFSAKEQEYFASKRNPYPSMATAFAVKEAFSKTLGTGIRGFELNEVSVEHDPLGAPFFTFTGHAAEIVRQRKLSFSLSLTHTDTVAAAFVVAAETNLDTNQIIR